MSPGSQAALRAVGRDQFVTGEAVPLDLRIAQLPSRSMAITVDLLVQILLIVLGIWVLTYAGRDSATASGWRSWSSCSSSSATPWRARR